MPHNVLTSLHGRRFGLGSSDRVVGPGGALMDRAEINSAVSTSAASIKANGVTSIESSATAANFTLAAPYEGCRAELTIQSTSSLITIDAEAATYTFGNGSTAFTFTGAANSLLDQSAVFRGMSSTWYALVSGSSLFALD